MPTLGVAVITYNEERNIARCLASVQPIANTICVVDSGSTDQTIAIAQTFQADIISQAFLGHIAQKNSAWDACRGEYILSLDADEAIDDTLRHYLHEFMQAPTADAIICRRRNNYCGRWIRFGAWRSDDKLRVSRKNKARWGGTNPHDKLETQGEARVIKAPGYILHWSYVSVDEHRKKARVFAEIAAKAYIEKGKRSSLFKIFFSPLFRFIRDYIVKLGFLDGIHGWHIARLTAWEVFLKYRNIYQWQTNK